MQDLKFYLVNNNYVKFLQEAEIEKRGFTRVPNLDYGVQHNKKFLCGVVLEVGKCSYYVPVSSFKEQKEDNFLIKDTNGNVVSSLRFNYMFPIPKKEIVYVDINKIVDNKYRNFVHQEWEYCFKNQDKIRLKAEKTYNNVIEGKRLGLVHNSCDFNLLEQKMVEYVTEQKSASGEVATTQTATSVGQQQNPAPTNVQRTVNRVEMVEVEPLTVYRNLGSSLTVKILGKNPEEQKKEVLLKRSEVVLDKFNKVIKVSVSAQARFGIPLKNNTIKKLTT